MYTDNDLKKEGIQTMNDRIIDNFLSLAAIPRKSHHEEAVSRFLHGWAESKGLSVCRDEAGNVIIDKPGTSGHENAPRTILQAHMDMVCVAEPGRAYDPLKDPIKVIHNGKTLTADGTSLGGDDGAGVAIAMSILEDREAVHGPVRAIFTVDEEDGMNGANALDERHLDARYVINLDWEAFGSLCCSSAGSDMYALRRAAKWEPVSDSAFFTLTLNGFEGGHSGAQIHLGRANAIRVAAQILRQAAQKADAELRVCAFKGGSAHNAVPSSSEAVAAVDNAHADAFLEAAGHEIDMELEKCGMTDPHAVITIVRTEATDQALGAAMSRDVLSILTEVHDGVNTWSKSIPGLVESSANTGLAELKPDCFEFVIHQRSSEPEITEAMKKVFLSQAKEYGFTLEILSSGPAWPVKPDSELVKLCEEEFMKLFGEDIRVEPVHAGLECGAWANKNPALDIISIGPDILDIHSPKETLILESVYNCDKLVRAMLRRIADQ